MERAVVLRINKVGECRAIMCLKCENRKYLRIFSSCSWRRASSCFSSRIVVMVVVEGEEPASVIVGSYC